MRGQTLREVKFLAQSHNASKKQSQNSNQVLSNSKFRLHIWEEVWLEFGSLLSSTRPAHSRFFKNLFNLFYFWLLWVFVAARAFSSCGEWGLLFVAVCGLIAVASLVVEHGL